MSDKILTKTSEISILNNQILIVKLLDNNFDIDIEEVIAQINAAEKLTGGKYMPVLVDARESYHTLTSEAKEYVASHDKKTAEAILVSAIHQRLIATVFLKLSSGKNLHPSKVFTDEGKAIAWLTNFVVS